MEYAYLSEFFPNMQINQQMRPKLPEYKKIRYDLELKPYQKLVIINNKLQVDTRNFQSIRRMISKDNRWTILDHLILLEKTYDIDHIKRVLVTTTYANDKKWCDKFNYFLSNSICRFTSQQTKISQTTDRRVPLMKRL